MAIIIYPMLVSSSVSRVAVPVISKALEKYLITYKEDEIIERANKEADIRAKGIYKIQGGNIVRKVREQIDYLSEQDLFDEFWAKEGQRRFKNMTAYDARSDPDVLKAYTDWLSRKKDESKIAGEKEKAAREKRKERGEIDRELDRAMQNLEKQRREREEEARRAASATVRVEQYDTKTMSLEPTVIKVDTEEGGVRRTKLIGVKVLPALAKSDEKITRVLIYDQQSKSLHKGAIKLGRYLLNKLIKYWFKVLDRLTLGLVKQKSPTVTGDVVKDIIRNRTVYMADIKDKSRIFLCISSNDVDDDFFQSAGGIYKLFKMGWTSIIIADDVNRIAHFCTEEYRGQCASIPYASLYNTFSSMQVYDSLIDAKKSGGALFKRRFSISKVRGSLLADKKLQKYRGR